MQKRIVYIYNHCKDYNTSNIDNSILEKYLPNDKDFHLFIFDFFSLQKNQAYVSSNFEKNYIINSIRNHTSNLSEQTENLINEQINNSLDYQTKININLVFIGSGQSGKSTTIGHLLLDTNTISSDYFENIKKYVQQYNFYYSYRYAWIFDSTYHERTWRHTIESKSKKLETEKYFFSVIDIPGKKNLVKNATLGIFQGDAAIIVVPADEISFQEIFSEETSFKDQIITAFTMGIKQIIVGINKMDLCHYSEERYLEIKKDIRKFLKKIGYDDDSIQYICYSGLTGHNLVNRYENDDKLKINKTPWYKGNTLLEALDQLKPPKRLINKPLRIPIFGYHKITGVGYVFIGVIKSGILIKDNSIFISPFRQYINGEEKKYKICKSKCISIEKYYKDLNMAIPGDIIGIKEDSSRYFRINHKGVILGNYEEKFIPEVKNFTSIIIFINIPNPIKVGFSPIIYCHTSQVRVKFTEFIYIVDKKTNKIMEKNPKEIKNGEKAVVRLEPLKEFICEKYSDNPYLGSFTIYNNNKIIAVGKIKEVANIKYEKKDFLDCNLFKH